MRTVAMAFCALELLLCACGSANKAPAPTPVAAVASVGPVAQAKASAAPHAVAAAPDHTLTRSAVRAAVAQGLGGFLQHVELDDSPVMVAGKFRGFRIALLKDAMFWKGVDLKAGDVVTRVNGFPIERPEQAQRAFESLEASSELRVSYERDGEPHELVYTIVDDR